MKVREETVTVFNTSIGTTNLGDYIIFNSAKKELSFLNEMFVIEGVTHLYNASLFNLVGKKSHIMKKMVNSDYKFIIGTNLLDSTRLGYDRNWKLSFLNKRIFKGSVLVGVGSCDSSIQNRILNKIGAERKNKNYKFNLFAKLLYKHTLSKDYYHSVRDEKTKTLLESIGLKAVNTGCPTLWSLTDEHCKKIPKHKSKKVIFTLTDYLKSNADQRIIDILKKEYEIVMFWPQGIDDIKYLRQLDNTCDIEVLSPSLNSFKDSLKDNVDYVGTRLHGGIFAMQNFVRTIIIVIDNRARDMKSRYNLNTIERNDILTSNCLEDMINSEFETKIDLDEENIDFWKNQFTK